MFGSFPVARSSMHVSGAMELPQLQTAAKELDDVIVVARPITPFNLVPSITAGTTPLGLWLSPHATKQLCNITANGLFSLLQDLCAGVPEPQHQLSNTNTFLDILTSCITARFYGSTGLQSRYLICNSSTKTIDGFADTRAAYFSKSKLITIIIEQAAKLDGVEFVYGVLTPTSLRMQFCEKTPSIASPGDRPDLKFGVQFTYEDTPTMNLCWSCIIKNTQTPGHASMAPYQIAFDPGSPMTGLIANRYYIQSVLNNVKKRIKAIERKLQTPLVLLGDDNRPSKYAMCVFLQKLAGPNMYMDAFWHRVIELALYAGSFGAVPGEVRVSQLLGRKFADIVIRAMGEMVNLDKDNIDFTEQDQIAERLSYLMVPRHRRRKHG